MLTFMCSAAQERKAQLEEEGCLVKLDLVPFTMSVVTPVMQRALSVSASQTVTLFTDTTASCDQMNTSMTVVLLSTKAGAVPLGVSLHSSQSADSYTAAFTQLKELWSGTQFEVSAILTDDSRAMMAFMGGGGGNGHFFVKRWCNSKLLYWNPYLCLRKFCSFEIYVMFFPFVCFYSFAFIILNNFVNQVFVSIFDLQCCYLDSDI